MGSFISSSSAKQIEQSVEASTSTPLVLGLSDKLSGTGGRMTRHCNMVFHIGYFSIDFLDVLFQILIPPRGIRS